MGVQLVGIGPRTDHVQIFRPMRRIEEVPHRQGGIVPISQHVSIGERWIVGECYPWVSTDGRREN